MEFLDSDTMRDVWAYVSAAPSVRWHNEVVVKSGMLRDTSILFAQGCIAFQDAAYRGKKYYKVSWQAIAAHLPKLDMHSIGDADWKKLSEEIGLNAHFPPNVINSARFIHMIGVAWHESVAQTELARRPHNLARLFSRIRTGCAERRPRGHQRNL